MSDEPPENDTLVGAVFDAALADAPLLVGLIEALVAEGTLPPRRVATMFARARGLIRHLDAPDLPAMHLDLTAETLRRRLDALGYKELPPRVPPDWWKSPDPDEPDRD